MNSDGPDVNDLIRVCDAIEHAVMLATAHLDVRDQIRDDRANDPTSCPIRGYGPLGNEETARRIVACLLNHGWTPGEDPR